MEENVALDSNKQKKFVKSVKGIKKLIKKNEAQAKAEADRDVPAKLAKDRKKKKERGLVYLSHIPHGFYEHQMTQYFKQFGVVTNARVIRSKRTGNSKGFAFVEFREPAVAQIVAETMNNYLMGKRLIKAFYIPPEKQRRALRKHWNSLNNPSGEYRLKMKKAYNANKDKKGELKRVKHLLANLTKTKQKLGELGINYDFFKPVDVPERLAASVAVKDEKDEEKPNLPAKDKKSKNIKLEKGEKNVNVDKESKKAKKTLEVKTEQLGKKKEKTKQDRMITPKDGIKEKVKSAPKQQEVKKDKDKKNKLKPGQDNQTTKKEQKGKKQALKDKGVQPLEDFIKVGDIESGNDSDSSYEFDSDEFSKMIGNDDEDSDVSLDDNDTGDDDSEEVETGDEEDSDEDIPPPKQQDKKKPVQNHVQKPVKKVAQPVVKKNPNIPEAQKKQHKRKAPQKPASPPKKAKFEKQNVQKPLNKQFKKKK